MGDPGPPPTSAAPSVYRLLLAWLMSVALSAPLGYGLPAIVSWSLQNDLLTLGLFLVLSGPTLLVATWLYQRIVQRPPLPGRLGSGCAAPFIWYLVLMMVANWPVLDCGIVECGNKWAFWGILGSMWGIGMLAYFFLGWFIQRRTG